MKWLLQFCAARAAFAAMFTAYSAVLPLVRQDWEMTAWQAGLIQSVHHAGFLVSLFSVGFLTDRFVTMILAGTSPPAATSWTLACMT